jgi:hypothetical protein
VIYVADKYQLGVEAEVSEIALALLTTMSRLPKRAAVSMSTISVAESERLTKAHRERPTREVCLALVSMA